MNKEYNILKIFILLLFAVSLAFTAGDKSGGKGALTKVYTGKSGDAYRMDINNISLPLNNEGILADVSINGPAGGTIDNKIVIFSAGFFMSGQTNGVMWSNAVASASRIQDYVPGTIADGRTDPRNQIYVVNSADPPFSQSWQDWKDAVALGADFYDGNNDGVYDPSDLNNNGLWDTDEDRPDLLGDETAWCVYNDGVDPALRRFNDVSPQGIEIRQTVFGFAAKGLLGNILFVRYNILNTGSVADLIDSVYFGVWADPDVGDPYSDLVGCDTTLNAGFTYNYQSDNVFGGNPPCYLVDFFQGPIAYVPGETFTDVNGNGVFDPGIDIPLSIARVVKGPVMGIDSFPGATTLGVASFVHYQQSDPRLGDPNNRIEARNYLIGQDKIGGQLDPCTWTLGEVIPASICAEVDKRYWYSGDPVGRTGWLNKTPTDQRQMLNTGPFQLKAGVELTITAAMVIGRGNDALSSITQSKSIDVIAQRIYDNNFEAPSPPPQPIIRVETSDEFIDLIWNTREDMNFVDKKYGNLFEGFKVYAYRTPSPATIVANQENIKLLRFFDKENYIQNIYMQDPESHGFINEFPVSDTTKLDSVTYADSTKGILRVRITKDPFTNGPLIKGKEYYFAVTAYGINYENLQVYPLGNLPVGTRADYVYTEDKPINVAENVPKIIIVTLGDNSYNPPLTFQNSNHTAGASSGQVAFDVINKTQLRGNEYQINFYRDPSTENWTTFWKLTNNTTGEVLIDSSKLYSYNNTSIADQPIVEGFIPRIQNITPIIDSTWTYRTSAESNWFKRLDVLSSYNNSHGVFYVGDDIPQDTTVPLFSQTGGNPDRSSVMTAEKLRRVELRFGTTGKAYRYLHGYATPAPLTYKYAAGITTADTSIGKFGEGFVDVPFTAWVVDDIFKEEYQLAVGFVERKRTAAFGKGTPDGIWDPTDSVKANGEVIIIFASPYTSEPQFEYTGGTMGGVTFYTDLMKFTNAGKVPAGLASQLSAEQVAKMNSPWFDAMYVVGLSRINQDRFYTNGDILDIGVAVYPYTQKDVYKFNTLQGNTLTDAQRKELFNKVNVFPNPLFAYNPATSYNNGNPDEPFVTFSNLPRDVSVKIFTLSGVLVRTIGTNDKANGPDSPFLRWDLQNEDGLRVASGMYLAIVNAPGYGEKILKFAVIMPQKQIQRF